MNQSLSMSVTLTEAFLGASDMIMKERRLDFEEASCYRPEPGVHFFHAAHAGTQTPVFVIGKIKNIRDYAASPDVTRLLLEEPDDFKIGTNPYSNRSFIVRHANAVAFNQPTVDLYELLYPVPEDNTLATPALAYA